MQGRQRPRVLPPPGEPPPGWRFGAPDFVGVGAQRAGTSWWNRLIVDHPGVVPPLVPVNSSGAPLPGTTKKELHYFDAFSATAFEDHDVELYHRFFPRPEGALTGEWTPSYMVDRWVPPLLRRAAPDAKLLVILRDPLERYRSWFVMRAAKRERRGLPKMSLDRYADAPGGRRAYRRNLYWSQLSRLLEHFDRSQIQVLQYERCVESPRAELRRTYEFLGLDPGHLPAEDLISTNLSRPRDELPADFRDEIVRRLSDDIGELAARFPEVDLRLWPHFRHLAT